MKATLADCSSLVSSGTLKGTQRDKSCMPPKSGLPQCSTTIVSDAGMGQSIAAIDFPFPFKFVVRPALVCQTWHLFAWVIWYPAAIALDFLNFYCSLQTSDGRAEALQVPNLQIASRGWVPFNLQRQCGHVSALLPRNNPWPPAAVGAGQSPSGSRWRDNTGDGKVCT